MFKKQWFIRFITANIEYKNDIALLRKLVIINALVLAIILLFSTFALYNAFRAEYLIASLDAAGLLVCGTAYYQLYVNKRLDFAVVAVSATLMSFLLALAIVGQNQEYSLIWTFFLPIFVIMLNGRKTGAKMVLAFYGILIPLAFYNIGIWQDGDWTFTSFLRFSLASLVMVYTCYYSELAMEKSYSSFKEAQKEEKRLLAERNSLMLETLEKQDKLLTDISHELRTPLTIMRVQLEALQDSVVKDPATAYQTIQAKITEIDSLIHDIAKASSLGHEHHSADKTAINVNQFIRELVESFKDRFDDAKLALSLQLENDECMVVGNRDNLRVAFEKILDNSLRYTDSSGKVRVTVMQDDHSMSVVVEDSAPGVRKHDRVKLFDRLFRVESSRNRETGGAGLGLSVAKTIVEAHKGQISIDESSLGGLKVTVELPLA
ncbi:MAG: hypothetical protein HWE27_19380 [Gammaproteobacteria bacterium]|nr:hypothetical protein [Gammaproteobacteria bacterium]